MKMLLIIGVYQHGIFFYSTNKIKSLLEKAKLVTEKMKFLTNFLVAKFSDGIREGFHVFPH